MGLILSLRRQEEQPFAISPPRSCPARPIATSLTLEAESFSLFVILRGVPSLLALHGAERFGVKTQTSSVRTWMQVLTGTSQTMYQVAGTPQSKLPARDSKSMPPLQTLCLTTHEETEERRKMTVRTVVKVP